MNYKRSLLGNIILYGFLLIMLVITMIPLLYTASASLKTNSEIMSGGANLIPKVLTFENYPQAWDLGNFSLYTLNSVIVAVMAVGLVVVISSASAYVFQRGKFPGKVMIYNIYLATMFVSAGSITLFPILQLTSKMGINNLFGLAIVQTFTMGAMNIFLQIGYFKTISRELDEAAKIDGCSFFRIYWNIILPVTTPILATIALLTFRASWNDYLMPLVISMGKPKMYTLIVGITQLKSFGGESASKYNLMMAGTMFSVVPMIAIYTLMNQYFIAGITAGALKG